MKNKIVEELKNTEVSKDTLSKVYRLLQEDKIKVGDIGICYDSEKDIKVVAKLQRIDPEDEVTRYLTENAGWFKYFIPLKGEDLTQAERLLNLI